VTGASPAIAYNAAMRRMICLFLFGAGLAGCGGTGSTPPSPGTAGPQNLVSAAYRYAACMRQHGVPVPDPQVSNQGGSQRIRQVVHVSNSPAFKAAQKACAGILPGPQNENPTQIAQQRHQRALGLLSFARCMRSHGVTSFPDPDAQGQINEQALANARVDVHLPSVFQAAETCIPASHGALTRAALAQAANRGG
jgi:hypothetical protein